MNHAIVINWKTTIAGAILIITGVADFLGYGPGAPGAAGAEIIAGLGLILAKDAGAPK